MIGRIVTYECEQCGSEIVVTETGETRLSPIYCCNVVVAEVSSLDKKPAKPKKKVTKKAAKKITKKVTKKIVAKKAAVKKVVKKTPASSKKSPKTKK